MLVQVLHCLHAYIYKITRTKVRSVVLSIVVANSVLIAWILQVKQVITCVIAVQQYMHAHALWKIPLLNVVQ
jgi:hypothetical protein